MEVKELRVYAVCYNRGLGARPKWVHVVAYDLLHATKLLMREHGAVQIYKTALTELSGFSHPCIAAGIELAAGLDVDQWAR